MTPVATQPNPVAVPLSEAAQQHMARRDIWQRKYAIRACYRGWFDRMKPFIVPGPSLEVGAGAGGFKDYWPELILTDVVYTPLITVAADGMRLPVRDGSISNLVVIDLLHHLQDPHLFFSEAERVLKPGGRVLAIEPYITPASYVGYKLLHHEDVWFGGYHKSGDHKVDPWEGNLALPNLLFTREADQWQERHPHLQIAHRRKFSLFDFQLAGGFKPYAFVGNRTLYDMFCAVDRRIDWLGPLVAFRIFVVIERVER